MNRIGNILDMEISKFLPLITIGNILNTLYTLEDQGVEPSTTALFIPAIVSNFGGPLIANLVYKQFNFSAELLVVFFITLILFSVIYKMKFLRYFVSIFPMVGKSLFFVSLKNNRQPIYNILGYLIISNVFDKILKKVVFNKDQLEYTKEDITDLGINISIVILSKIFQPPDHYIFSIVLVISVFPTLNGFYQKRVQSLKKISKKNLKVKSIPPNIKKRQVRRSSISSLA
ncbi:hypothetical protein P3W45_001535 [Vairimorpha bombi]|jgi:hypothetical protein